MYIYVCNVASAIFSHPSQVNIKWYWQSMDTGKIVMHLSLSENLFRWNIFIMVTRLKNSFMQ